VTNSRNNHSNPDGKVLAKYTMSVTVMMTGVAAHKIRRFEEFGLCNPARTGSKQRLYSDYDVEVIREIAVLEEEGINLPGVKTILSLKKYKGRKSVLLNRKE
jgi:MerR family glutamine synthetase transcriptional repressor